MGNLEQSQAEEEKGIPISHPAVCLLKSHVNATIGRIMGSDQSQFKLQSQIWSTAIYLGPPYLWIMINPIDLHDPIAQVFARENIDLDNFIATIGPDGDTSKEYCHRPICCSKVLPLPDKYNIGDLIPKLTKYQVKSGMGILGHVAAYFGTVESQGWGTLHLHLLIWLKHAPTSDEILELLKSEEFHAQIIAYIQTNLCAYLPGLESATSVEHIPCQKDITYN